MVTSEERAESHNSLILEIKHRANKNIISGSDVGDLSTDTDIQNIKDVLRENFSIVFDANEVSHLIEFSNEKGFSLDKVSHNKSKIASTFIELVENLAAK